MNYRHPIVRFLQKWGLGPDQSHHNQSRLWSSLQTTLLRITQITPKWIHIILKIFSRFTIFEQLALALKNRVCSENFHCIDYTFYIQDFWATGVCLKNRVDLNSLYWIYCIFYIQDFWATCACPEKQSVPWNFHCIEYTFYHSGFLSNLRFLWKTECDLKFFTVLNILFTFRIFEQLALALKFFTVLNILFTFRIFEQLALSLKNRGCPEIFHCIEYTFCIQDFWAICACPENRVALEFFTVLQYFLSFRIFEQLALALKTVFALKIFKPV